jgi:hypothetical protein
MTTETVANTRGAFRLSVIESVRTEIAELLTPIEGGDLDGIEVVSAGEVTEALERVKTSPLPKVDDQTAEVRTPADVYVDTICPECNLPTRILVQLSSVLETTRETGSTIKLKAKAKGKTHVHHQLSLDVDKAAGQESFGLEDIVQPGDELTDEERAAGDGEIATDEPEPNAGDVDLGEGAPNAEPDPDADDGPTPDGEIESPATCAARPELNRANAAAAAAGALLVAAAASRRTPSTPVCRAAPAATRPSARFARSSTRSPRTGGQRARRPARMRRSPSRPASS